MADQLEYFLIRTLPSKKERILKMFGNRSTSGLKKTVAGIKVQLAEREAAYLKEVFEGSADYGSNLKSHLKSILPIRDRVPRVNCILALASLSGSLSDHKYFGMRIQDRKDMCFINIKRESQYLMVRSSFSYKNIIGICSSEGLFLYDAFRMDQGAVVAFKGAFNNSSVYKNDIWIVLQEVKAYADSGLGLLNTREILRMFGACTDIPTDAMSRKADSAQIFKSRWKLVKKSPEENSGLVVDPKHCYIAYRCELLVINKRNGEVEARIKYPNSNLEGIVGRGTKIMYASTRGEMSALRVPSMRYISSVDTYNKKERKIVSVKLVRGVELVFAVGQNTGGVSIFCLLGRKLLRVARCEALMQQPLVNIEAQFVPNHFVDDNGSSLYAYGYHRPVKFEILWT